MATVQKFEDLICWQKARLLTREIYREFKDEKFKSLNIPIDYGFKDQIQRASVSIMSNIAEGFERGTRQEFLNYLYIAKGSAGEVRAQLYVALDAGYLNIETFQYLNALALDCSRLISSFIKHLKQSPHGGLQHKKEKSKAQTEREEFDALIARSLREGKSITEYEEFQRMNKELEEKKKQPEFKHSNFQT